MQVELRAAGHNILVKPVKVKNTSVGGILLGDTTKEDKAIGLGEIVAIGSTAFYGIAGCNPKEYPTGDARYNMEPNEIWGCKVGDVVVYNRFVGFNPDVPEYKEFKVIMDTDIKMVAIGEFEVSKTDI